MMKYQGKTVVISGSGNVAQYAAEKVIQLGGKVVTLSDSGGYIYDKDGIDTEKLDWVMDLKNNKRGRISEYTDKYKSATYHKGETPWGVKCDIALPCATQNELDGAGAKHFDKERLYMCCRRRQYALNARCHSRIPRVQNIICSGESVQCRRRGNFRIGDVAEFITDQLDP